MQCPEGNSVEVIKNGHRYGKQCYRCKQCKRQFVESYSERGYSENAKQICLRMYNARFRQIERCTGIGHNTVINWVKELVNRLPETPEVDEIPDVGEIDELQTLVDAKANKIWLWTVVNHFN
jgi:insertion element IS1 protein InsB